MKIEKGIHAPMKVSDLVKVMEVGDSVLDREETSASSLVYAGLRKFTKRNGMRFRAKAEQGGLRIWRIA